MYLEELNEVLTLCSAKERCCFQACSLEGSRVGGDLTGGAYD